MNRKQFETVFFIKDLSVEEQHRIINTRVPEDPELQIVLESKKHLQKTSGDVFYAPSSSLYAPVEFCFKRLEEGNSAPLLAALCSLPPFSNFLQNMSSKIDDRIVELPTAMKILEALDYFRDKAKKYFPDQDWSKFDQRSPAAFFAEILKALHSELLRRYRFTEDSWEEALVNGKPGNPHSEFSPVVDLFYTKTSTQDRRSESLCIVYAFNASVRKAMSDFEASLSCVVKYSHIVTVALSGAEAPPELRVAVAGKNYRLRSVVASSEGKLVACIREGDSFVVLDSFGVSEMKKGDVFLYLLAFYVAERYDFDF